MDSTPHPENGRQSRGLARFWPVHGMPVPIQRQAEDDAGEPPAEPTDHNGPPARPSVARPPSAGAPAGPTGEQQLSDPHSARPRRDQPQGVQPPAGRPVPRRTEHDDRSYPAGQPFERPAEMPAAQGNPAYEGAQVYRLPVAGQSEPDEPVTGAATGANDYRQDQEYGATRGERLAADERFSGADRFSAAERLAAEERFAGADRFSTEERFSRPDPHAYAAPAGERGAPGRRGEPGPRPDGRGGPGGPGQPAPAGPGVPPVGGTGTSTTAPAPPSLLSRTTSTSGTGSSFGSPVAPAGPHPSASSLPSRTPNESTRPGAAAVPSLPATQQPFAASARAISSHPVPTSRSETSGWSDEHDTAQEPRLGAEPSVAGAYSAGDRRPAAGRDEHPEAREPAWSDGGGWPDADPDGPGLFPRSADDVPADPATPPTGGWPGQAAGLPADPESGAGYAARSSDGAASLPTDLPAPAADAGVARIPTPRRGAARRAQEDAAAGHGADRSDSEDLLADPTRRTVALTGDAPLRPGDIAPTPIALWDKDATQQFLGEWHEVKAQFVDDPVAALTRAHDLLTEAVHELTDSLLAERDELDPLRRTSTPDTEAMRMAMRGYREFLDRILAL